ncbi:MAG: DNA polymerase I, partial [Flavicella sp.]
SDVFQELEFRRSMDTVNKLFNNTKTTNSSEETQKPSDKNKPMSAEPQLDLFTSPTSENEVETGYETLEKTDHFYQYIDSQTSRSLLIKKLLIQKNICFELISTSNNEGCQQIIGAAFSYQKGKGYFVRFSDNNETATSQLHEFKAVFENESIEKIGQNLKETLKTLAYFNLDLRGPLFDTSLAHYLINPDMRHSIHILAESYLNYQPIASETILGKGRNKISIEKAKLEKQTMLLVEQCDLTLQLKDLFEIELKEKNIDKLYRDIEIPLLRVLSKMEQEGINIDSNYLKELSDTTSKDIEQLEENIFEKAGEKFNLASPKQLGIVLFEKLKLVEKPKKTKTGQFATNEDVLSKLAPNHPIIKEIIKWRGLVKLKSTYIDALPNEVNKETNRIHTTYAQTVAATGRLSSNNPNLQNIPIRTSRGKQVRASFVPKDENYLLFAADYSQIELRIIAALSKEENMIKAFQEGQDIHATTAAKVYNIPLEEVTREQRGNAKAVNFGILYGQGAFTLAEQTGMSRKEAKELIANYYETYPTLKAYMGKQVDFARDNGYVETVLGRRRYLKNINSQNGMVRAGDERNAVNAPIQGSAADIIKIAMINIQNRLDEGKYNSKMLLQVHDELVFDIHKEELDTLQTMIKKEMENAFKMEVPLDVETGIGQNWLQAH